MKVRDIIADNSVWMPNEHYDEVKPLVSVILPTYSRAKTGYLKRCIDSILKQTFRRLELIIVIDASIDGTIDICKKYMSKDSRVNIILHKSNIGLPSISCYEGYLKTRSEYIAWTFDDNTWELDAIAKTYDFMEMNNVKASYGITKIVDPNNGNIAKIGLPNENIEEVLPFRNCIGNGSVLLRKDVIDTIGLYDPHLALTRICDWDLWRRIINKFDFVPTGIEFNFEQGTMLSDSLGNTYKWDQWFIRERWSHREERNLSVDAFEDIDILEFSESNSKHYFSCLAEAYSQYEQKKWFSKKEFERIQSAQPNLNHKYGLIVCTGISASLMCFTRYESKEITLCFIHPVLCSHHYLINSDFIIFPRDIEMGNLNALAKKLDIPVYYFTDDNFKELLLDTYDPYLEGIAIKTNTKTLKQFEGVIVSTESLRDWFQNKKLHKNIILMPPIWRETISEKHSHKTPTIGFMGGNFRMKVLVNCVIPALQKIAKNQPLRMICPCTKETEQELLKNNTENFEIIPYYRTLNFEKLINQYNEIGVDILIHCGGNLNNNIYKNVNILLNATTLGIPLLVSDIEPYNNLSNEIKEAFILTRNNVEAWESNLRTLLNNPNERQLLTKNATAYCKEAFSKKTVWQEFEGELAKLPQHNNFYLLKRYEKFVDESQSGALSFVSQIQNPRYKQFIPDELCFSGEIIGRRRYGFTSPVNNIREAGLLFAVIGKCEGTVTLHFLKSDSQTVLATVNIDIDSLVKDNYTNFYFMDPIVILPDEIVYMDIEMTYSNKNGYVGLFEDKANRTFIYKVMNKLGHPLPGKNALFIDCRS